jgi:hypothetical protein
MNTNCKNVRLRRCRPRPIKQVKSVSLWDELPYDMQEVIIICRTRLHFAECLAELMVIARFRNLDVKDE